MAISLDVVTRLNDRSARDAARDAERYFENASRRAGTNFDRNLSVGFDKSTRSAEKASVSMQRSFDKAATATGRVRVEQEKYNALISKGVVDQVKLVQHTERLATARRNEAQAVREAATSHREYSRHIRDLGNTFDGASSSASGFTASITQVGGAMTKLSGVAVPAAIVGLGAALVQVAGVAASATQSLWLLPGAVGAVGAAFGTIKLATVGLDDAFKNMGDPEKFAEALRELAPSAQQFMLSIKSMMPALTELKNATQDAFFNGFGAQLNQLANQYLPMIQQATTGVASAFNQMLSGAASQLMTPSTMQSMQTFFQNVASSFQRLGAAAAPFTRALGDILAVGSDVLPDLAQGITNAATSFANFISQARQSGDLKRWLSEGLDTMRDLGAIIWSAGKSLMSLAPMAREILPTMVDMFKQIEKLMPAIGAAAMVVGMPIGLWAVGIDNAARAFEGIKTVVEGVGNAVIPVINRIGTALSNLLSPVRAQLNRMIEAANHLPGVNIPTIGEFAPIAPLGSGQSSQGGSLGGQVGADAGQSSGTLGGGELPGAPWELPSNRPGWGIPEPAVQGWNPRQAHRDQVSEWMSEAASSASAQPVVPRADLPGLMPGVPVTASVFSAQTAVADARTRLAEAEARANQLLADATATAQERLDARNDVAKAEREAHEADLRFAEAQQNAFEQQGKTMGEMSTAMGEFGAALDGDFGISDGLSGIVENFTRFVGNLIAAPALAVLERVAGANPNEGSGLVGMLAANGVFGEQFTPGALTSASSPSPSSIGPAALQPGGGNVAAMMQLAQRSSGGRYVFGGSDLANGLSDCSGAVSDLVEILTTGQTTPGRLFSTGDAAQVLAGLGFQQGFMPGALNIGFKNGGPGGGHMAATLPNGVAFESGGGTGQGATYGGPAVGANDPQFTDRWFLPVGGGFGGGGSVSSPISSPGGGTVPVFVVNMPGGGGFPAALAPGAPTSPGATPGTPGADGYLNSNIAPGGGGGVPGLTDPALANPGLNNPAAPGAPLPPLGSLPGSGGPLGLPGVGMPGSAGMGGLGGQSYPGQGGGEGGIGLGGMALDGIMAATSGLDMMAPGAGAAAKVGIQVANRAAKYAGQVGGIVTGGILDTLTPAGDNPKASIGNSWFGKIAGGIASAAPALPNMAGGKPPDPPAEGQGQQGQGGNTVTQHVTLNNNHATEDVQGNQAVREMGAMFTP